MSRHVNKPHGLMISTNGYSLFRPLGEIEHFTSVVSFESYESEDFGISAYIDTPAQQLCISHKQYYFPTLNLYNHLAICCEPQAWLVSWMDENTPGWGMHYPKADFNDSALSLYFKKRKHALMFCRHIESLLEGIPKKL